MCTIDLHSLNCHYRIGLQTLLLQSLFPTCFNTLVTLIIWFMCVCLELELNSVCQWVSKSNVEDLKALGFRVQDKKKKKKATDTQK